MNIIIFTLGLFFVSLEMASAQTDKELTDEIYAIGKDVVSIGSQVIYITNIELQNLQKKMLKIFESNELVIQTKEELKNYEEKGVSVKECQLLYTANYYSVGDQLYVKANNSITHELTKTENFLVKAYLDLNSLAKQVDNWDETSPENKDKIIKELNEYRKEVDRSKDTISTLVDDTLSRVEKNMFPILAREHIFKPVDECLKKIGGQ